MTERNDSLKPPTRPSQAADRIGETLRRAFDDAAAEPLPKSFEDLLRQLG